MPTERGDSVQTPGASPNDDPSTFEQSTLNGTTTTGNARLIVRDATQIQVIDTFNYWTALTVEGVLDEIAGLTGLDSAIQDQIDVINGRLTVNEADILSNAGAITALDVRLTTAEGTLATAVTNISTNTSNITANAVIAEADSIAFAIALGG